MKNFTHPREMYANGGVFLLTREPHKRATLVVYRGRATIAASVAATRCNIQWLSLPRMHYIVCKRQLCNSLCSGDGKKAIPPPAALWRRQNLIIASALLT